MHFCPYPLITRPGCSGGRYHHVVHCPQERPFSGFHQCLLALLSVCALLLHYFIGKELSCSQLHKVVGIRTELSA